MSKYVLYISECGKVCVGRTAVISGKVKIVGKKEILAVNDTSFTPVEPELLTRGYKRFLRKKAKAYKSAGTGPCLYPAFRIL